MEQKELIFSGNDPCANVQYIILWYKLLKIYSISFWQQDSQHLQRGREIVETSFQADRLIILTANTLSN